MPLTLPIRVGGRSARPAVGPRPFSQEWLATPPELRTPPPKRMPDLPPWVPSERVVAAILVMLLVLATVAFSGAGIPGTTAHVPSTAVTQPNAGSGETPMLAFAPPTATTTVTPEQTESAPTPAQTPLAVGGPESAASESPAVNPNADPRALLPTYRIVSYYGHPHSNVMGILGEYTPDELLAQLKDEVAAYERADPSRPVLPAFEIIVSVAQNWPADDGTYLLHTDADTIQSYVDFTRDNGILLILDLQIGHSTVANEIDRVREWLAEPNVHLALDPEFAMPEGAVPGDVIGSLDAEDVAVAQQELASIVAEYGLPPKILIVHRFTENMITNADKIVPVDGVQTVIDFDGHGDPANKLAGYQLFLEEGPAEFAGFKLFYQQDDPLLTPDEVVGLGRPPDVVIYQ